MTPDLKIVTKPILSETKGWFEKARPEPTTEHQTGQLAVHFEEVGEMIAELTPLDDKTNNIMLDTLIAVKHFADHIKRNPGCLTVSEENRVKFIDAICDQLVTATGSAHVFSMDPLGGLNEVNRSNFSKFVDGKPVYDEFNKVIKGPNYSKADLTPFM